MVLLLKKIINWYFYVFNELADPRVNDYPFMSNPFPIILLCVLYLYFVTDFGPRLMKNREPFNIEKIIIVFNVAQIFLCSFLVIRFMMVCAFEFNWMCEPIDYGTSWNASIQVYYAWIYHLIKILDLLDTIFFVLRKKTSHLSFLHIYHHTGMVFMTWVGLRFIAGGHGLFMGFVNCIVHAFMYFYYLISILNEEYKKSIWWKKYITQLQMGQFFFLFISFGQILFQPNCTYPKWVVAIFLPQNLFMFMLFADFYYRAYIKKKPELINNSKKNEEQKMETVKNGGNKYKQDNFFNSVHQNSEQIKTK